MTRKEKLRQRATAYANGDILAHRDAQSWEDGYRAAMRDIRKIRKAALRSAVQVPVNSLKDAFENNKQKAYSVCIALRQFLTPLR